MNCIKFITSIKYYIRIIGIDLTILHLMYRPMLANCSSLLCQFFMKQKFKIPVPSKAGQYLLADAHIS